MNEHKDKYQLYDVTEQLLTGLFPETTIEIKTFDVLDRFQLNENNEWVDDSPAIFVGVNISGETQFSITNLLSTFTGMEYQFFIC